MEVIDRATNTPQGLHLLAVDDDPSVRQMIADYLGDNDMLVTTLTSGHGVEELIERGNVDLLILDLKLPGEDGMQIARRLRQRWDLLARIRALLRRSRGRESLAEGLARIRAYRFAGWDLNVRLRRLTSPQGELVATTNSEFNLLVAFLSAPQRVLSREELLDLSRLHNAEVYDRSIDVQVGRLRRKIQPPGSSTALIRTERGAGYVFTAAVEIVR